jgi:DNA-binding transcriptional ArsR family regulator
VSDSHVRLITPEVLARVQAAIDGLPPGERPHVSDAALVLVSLTRWAKKDLTGLTVDITEEQIAGEWLLTPRRVRRALRAIADAGLIVTVRQGGGRTVRQSGGRRVNRGSLRLLTLSSTSAVTDVDHDATTTVATDAVETELRPSEAGTASVSERTASVVTDDSAFSALLRTSRAAILTAAAQNERRTAEEAGTIIRSPSGFESSVRKRLASAYPDLLDELAKYAATDELSIEAAARHLATGERLRPGPQVVATPRLCGICREPIDPKQYPTLWKHPGCKAQAVDLDELTKEPLTA